MSEFKKEMRGFKNKNKPIFRSIKFEGRLDRQRYTPKNIYIYPGDERRSLMRSFYIDVLTKIGLYDLVLKYSLDTYIMYQEYCELLSKSAKLLGDDFDKNWRYIHGIDKIDVDYDELSKEEMYDYAKKWVEDKTHTWFGDEVEFNSRYAKAVRKALDYGSEVTSDQILNVDEFLKTPELWATSGSGFDQEMKIGYIKNKYTKARVKLPSTKWNQAWSNSLYDLKKLFWKKKKRFGKAFVKPEVNKARLVVASDFCFYLKCSFVDQIIQKSMRGRDDTTLFMEKHQIFELWRDRFRKRGLAFPLDEEKFDFAPSKSMRTLMLKELHAYINRMSILQTEQVKEQLDEVMGLIEYASDGGTLLVNDAKLNIVGGIMSGERWTAFYDTIDNIAKAYMCRDWVEQLTGTRPEILDFCAQGDDQMNKITNKKDAALIICAMKEMGFLVNTKKVFVSYDRDEFLRKVLDKDCVVGYPARSIRSIFFRKFGKPELFDTIPTLRLQNILNGWITLMRRCKSDFQTFKKFIINDITGALKWSKDKANQWLMTSKSVGGAGIGSGSQPFTGVDNVQIRFNIDELTNAQEEWISRDENSDYEIAKPILLSTMSIQDIIPKKPTWFKGNIVFNKKDYKKGDLVVGMGLKHWARKRNIYWVPSVEEFTKLWSYEDIERKDILPVFRKLGAYTQVKKPEKKQEKTGFRISTYKDKFQSLMKPEEWKEKLKNKPKKWVLDFITSKTKINTPVLMPPPYCLNKMAKELNNYINMQMIYLRKPSYSFYCDMRYSAEQIMRDRWSVFDTQLSYMYE